VAAGGLLALGLSVFSAPAGACQAAWLGAGEPVAVASDPVTETGVVRLADGRLVVPAGLFAAEEAPVRSARIARLGETLRARMIRMHPLGKDRYDRERAQIFVLTGGEALWLQGMILADGLARVAMRPGLEACGAEMLLLERLARARGLGLWGLDDVQPLAAAEAARARDRFALVHGTVVSVAEVGERVFLNFGSDWRTDFTIALEAPGRRAMRDASIDPQSLAGQRVRVRGFVEDWNGPLIRVDHAMQIEPLGPQVKAEPETPETASTPEPAPAQADDQNANAPQTDGSAEREE